LLHSNLHVLRKYSDKVTSEDLAKKVKSQINNISMTLGSHKILITIDEGPSFRKDLYPNYKGHREHDFDMSEANKILSLTFDYRKFKGLESDDLIYLLSRQNIKSTIISNDADVALCTNENVDYFNIRTGRIISFSEMDRKALLLDKIIFGCKSDNIPKITTLNRPSIFNMLNNKAEDTILNNLKYLYKREAIQDFKLNYDLVNYDISIYKKYVPNYTVAI
jgi:5'-3' exonuclease